MEETALSLDGPRWIALLASVKAKRCTPFLGAGASIPPLPSATTLANLWADEDEYPLTNRNDLASVTQFLRTKYEDSMYPKYKIQTLFKTYPAPDFSNATQIHTVLASLALPVYLTTNYDDYMEQALRLKLKDPQQELCRWNAWVRKHSSSVFNKVTRPNYIPSEREPVVFHLHGHVDSPESLVLTEDDYVDFLSGMDEELLPEAIEGALTETNVLFLGYGLNDWNFRVLFRSMARYLERSIRPGHVSVQLLPPPPEKKVAVLEYLNKYFGALDIRVYWGTCQQFAHELCKRMQ